MSDRSVFGGWPSLVGVGRRSDMPVAAIVGVLVAVLAFAAISAPIELREAESESLEEALAAAPPSATQLTISLIDNFQRGTTAEPLRRPLMALEDVADDIDGGVLALYGEPRLVLDTSRFEVSTVDLVLDDDANPVGRAPALPTFMTFRVHPEMPERSRLVAGRTAAVSDERLGQLPVFEFETTVATAEELGWELGATVVMTTDTTDLSTRQFNGGLPDDFAGRLVGLRELDPPDDPFWAGDERLHRAIVADTHAAAAVFAFAIIHPDQLPGRPFLVDGHSPFALEQRRDLRPGAIGVDNSDAAYAGLVALDAAFSQRPTLTRPGVTAPLASTLESERDQRRTAAATISIAAAGVFGVAAIAIGQLVATVHRRRAGLLGVARARGATLRQIGTSSAAEAGAVALTGGAVGALCALAVHGRAPSVTGAVLVGVLVVVVVLVTVGVTLAMAPQPTGVAGASPHRWIRVVAGLIVVLALGAVVTLRRRGVITSDDGGAPGVDPLVIALPILVPLAAVVAVQWIVPAVAGWVAGRGLHLGAGRLVGVRRLVASPAAAIGALAVLVLALTVAIVGTGVAASLEGAAEDASWSEVGAPASIDTSDVAVAEALADVPGSVVAASGSARVIVETDDSILNVQLLAIDVAETSALTAGTAADEGLPDSLSSADADEAVPVVTARRLSGQLIGVGDELNGVGARSDQRFVVVETRDEYAGRTRDWIVADRALVEAVTGAPPVFDTLRVGVPDDQLSVVSSIAETADAELLVRSEALSDQLDDPLSRFVRGGYLLAAALAVVIAVIAVVAVAVVTARERSRELAVLGLLGAGRREIARAVAAELVPTVVVGVVVGALVGGVVLRLFDGRFDLAAFAAGTTVSIALDAVGATVASVGAAVAAVAAVIFSIRRVVQLRPSEVLRTEGAA